MIFFYHPSSTPALSNLHFLKFYTDLVHSLLRSILQLRKYHPYSLFIVLPTSFRKNFLLVRSFPFLFRINPSFISSILIFSLYLIKPFSLHLIIGLWHIHSHLLFNLNRLHRIFIPPLNITILTFYFSSSTHLLFALISKASFMWFQTFLVSAVSHSI